MEGVSVPLQGGVTRWGLRSLPTQSVLFPSIGTSYRKCWTLALYIDTRELKLTNKVFNEFINFSSLSHHVPFLRWWVPAQGIMYWYNLEPKH